MNLDNIGKRVGSRWSERSVAVESDLSPLLQDLHMQFGSIHLLFLFSKKNPLKSFRKENKQKIIAMAFCFGWVSQGTKDGQTKKSLIIITNTRSAVSSIVQKAFQTDTRYCILLVAHLLFHPSLFAFLWGYFRTFTLLKLICISFLNYHQI